MELLITLLLFGAVVLSFLILWSLRTAISGLGEAVTAFRESSAPAAPPATNGEAERQDLNNLRLQACERFTLMLERISIPNLLLRIPPDRDTSAREYTAQLLLAIRQEVEYNITQQIYVSDSLWHIITQARDNVSLLISRAAEGADSSRQIVDRLRLMSSRQPEDGIGLAQGAIRREAASVLTDH